MLVSGRIHKKHVLERPSELWLGGFIAWFPHFGHFGRHCPQHQCSVWVAYISNMCVCIYIYIHTYVFPSIFMRAYACILWLYIHVLMKTYDIHHIFHNIFNYIIHIYETIYIYYETIYIIYIYTYIYISIHTANIRQHLSILVLMKFQALSGGRSSFHNEKKPPHMVGPRIV